MNPPTASATGAEAPATDRLSEEELCPSELLSGQEQAFANDVKRLLARRDEFVAVACPACQGASDTAAFTKWGFAYRTCDSCQTLFMSPRPSHAVMEAYYRHSENYAYWAQHIFPASEASRREKLHRPWLQRIVEFCERFDVRRRRLIEIGAGFGTFCAVANEERAFGEVVAVEPTPEMAQACRDRGVTVVEKRVEDVEDEAGSADVVVAFEVIEHLFEPAQFLQQAWRLLGDDGLLVTSCPNGQGFDIATLQAESLAVDPEHVNLFHPESLRHLVQCCGFEVLEVTTPGRLDAEFVRQAVLEQRYDVSQQPFLQRVLVDEWDRLGWPFQQFLAQNGLSSHMWLAARKRSDS